MTNSVARPTAALFGGSKATVKAPLVAASGLLAKSNNWSSATTLTSREPPLPDPYSYAPDALSLATSCGAAAVIDGSGTKYVNPGCWSGGLSFKAKTVLSPGVYVVKGGTLEFTAGADVSATGPVTFVLTGDTGSTVAKLSITGNAVLNLSAPTTGNLRDILFYQDRRASFNSNENTLTGNSTSVFNGSFYFPTSKLNFTGNSSSKPVCARLVAFRLAFTGSSAMNISCSGTQRDKLLGVIVRLVA
jgi:hypothetical protein